MKNRQIKLFKMVLAIILVVSNGLLAQPEVSIHYLGHSSFILQFDNGVSVLTDYGTSNCWGLTSPIFDIGKFVPTVLIYSHRHEDHYNEGRKPPGALYQLENSDSLVIKGLSIRPVRVCERSVGVESSTAFIFLYKGLKICHLGDAQADIMTIRDQDHQNHIRALFPEQLDLLLMPIEGVDQFIAEAEIFVNFLKPKRFIPMHYWSEAYKTCFLDHLKSQSTIIDKSYLIINENSADYYLSLKDSNVSPVQVISLTPARYSK